MKRFLGVSVVLFALASCASAPAERKENRLVPSPAEPTSNRADRIDTVKKGDENRYKSEDEAPIKGDPAHERPPESRDAAVPAEPEREVSLPDSVEVVKGPALGEKPKVAVACVRGGKLVRRAETVRRIEHELGRDAVVEALERFDESAPLRLGLDELCARAAKQGARLLVIDARPRDQDADRTTYVLDVTDPWKVLAFTKPRATEPTGQELVARLVRSSRTGP